MFLKESSNKYYYKDCYMKIKKLFTFILTLFISLFSFNQIIKATDSEVTTAYDVSYYTYDTPDDYDLGYGVHYQRDLGYSKVNKDGVLSGQIGGAGKGGPISVGTYYHQQVNILSLNTTEDVKIVPYAILTGSYWKLSTIAASATDYEKRNPGYRVIAAINADFFNTSTPYGTTGVTVSNGEFFEAKASNPTIAFKNDGVGQQIVNITDNSSSFFITFYDELNNEVFKAPVEKINQDPTNNETSVFFLQRTKDKGTSWSTQSVNDAWIIEKAEKAVTIKINYFYGIGTISRFCSGTYNFETNSKNESNSDFAIKSTNPEVVKLLKEGAKVRVQREFTNSEAKKYNNFVGSQSQFLINGEFVNAENTVTQTTTRCPRTVIGTKEDGSIMMFVIDGRQVLTTLPDGTNIHNEFGYHGMGSCELATLMKHYGVINAWNLDGGGSSTLLVRKQSDWEISQEFQASSNTSNWYVTNSPSDGSARSDGNCLLIVAKVPEVKMSADNISKDSITLKLDTISEFEKYNDYYVDLNGTKKEVVDNKVLFDNLDSNKSYTFKLFALSDNKYVDLATKYTFQTALETATLKSSSYSSVIDGDGNINYRLQFSFMNTSSFVGAKVKIGDKEYDVVKNQVLLEDEINLLYNKESVKLIIKYDIKDGKGVKELEIDNVEYNLKSSLMVFDEINYYHTLAFNNLFK